jgi:hypothetical protein
MLASGVEYVGNLCTGTRSCRGTKPAAISQQQVRQALGLEISPSLVARADEVIE